MSKKINLNHEDDLEADRIKRLKNPMAQKFFDDIIGKIYRKTDDSDSPLFLQPEEFYPEIEMVSAALSMICFEPNLDKEEMRKCNLKSHYLMSVFFGVHTFIKENHATQFSKMNEFDLRKALEMVESKNFEMPEFSKEAEAAMDFFVHRTRKIYLQKNEEVPGHKFNAARFKRLVPVAVLIGYVSAKTSY